MWAENCLKDPYKCSDWQNVFHHLAKLTRDLHRLSEDPLLNKVHFSHRIRTENRLLRSIKLDRSLNCFSLELWKTTSLYVIDLRASPRTKPGIESMDNGHSNLPCKLWGRKAESCATIQRHSVLHLCKRMQSEEAAKQKADNHFQSYPQPGPQAKGAEQTPFQNTGPQRPSDAGPLWDLYEGRHLSTHEEDQ